jgi:signal transduction histidine kinase
VGFACLGGVFLAVYFGLGRGHPAFQNVFYQVIGAVGAVAVLVGVRLHRPSRPGPWYLMAAALVLLVLGDVVWTVFDAMGIEPFPSVADVLYLASYPVLAVALFRLRRPESKSRDRTLMIEAAIITTGVALLMWAPFIESPATDSSLTMWERAVSLAYPLADVLLVAVLVRAAVGAWSRAPAFSLLAASLMAMLAADLVFVLLVSNGSYHTGHPVDLGWLAMYVLVGAAALDPSMAAPPQPVHAPVAGMTRVRLGLLAAATLLAPAVLAAEALTGNVEHVLLISSVSALLFLLVLARMSLLVREVASKAEALDVQGQELRTTVEDLRRLEAEREQLLERTLRAAEEERVRIAADLHDGPIQRLAMMTYEFERIRRRVERDEEEPNEAFEQAQELLSREVQGLRGLMSSLRPPALDEQGLEGALRDHATAFEKRTRIDCVVDAELEERPQQDVETVLYRVAQEALANVAKHSRASRVWVDLRRRNGSVELAVRDDGVGFEVDSMADVIRDGHFGLVAMREQVHMAGGRYEISSRPGVGTTVWAAFEVAV